MIKRVGSRPPLTALELAAQHNYGYLFPEEIALLKQLASLVGVKHPQPLFINLGAGAGTSSLAMAEGCPHAQIVTFDINQEHFDLERKAFRYNRRLSCPTQVLASSHANHSELNLRPHLVFVDADHSKKAVRADIKEWLPRITNGGIIALHDYDHPDYPGVRAAVDALLSHHECLGPVTHTTIAFEIHHPYPHPRPLRPKGTQDA